MYAYSYRQNKSNGNKGQSKRNRSNMESDFVLPCYKQTGHLTCVKQGPRATPQCVQQTAGRTGQQSLLPGGRGGYQLQGELTSGLVRRLPEKPAEEYTSHCPFDKLSEGRCPDLKARTITSWGQGQVCRKVDHVSGCR